MKKILIFFLFFSVPLLSQTPRYNIRIVYEKAYNSSFTERRLVFDFNGLVVGQYAAVNPPVTDGGSGYAAISIDNGYLGYGGFNSGYYTYNMVSDATLYRYVTTSQRAGDPYNVSFYVRYDPLQNRKFDEHDRIIETVKFIDIDGNSQINYDDLYVQGADPKAYANKLVYWTDNNNDGNADEGEIFSDSQATVSHPISATDIPIRASLYDTDGDGVDEGEDEDEDDEEDQEYDLDDKLPGLEQFKNILKLDTLSIPSPQDISFEIDVGRGISYQFNGIQQDSVLNKMRSGMRDCLAIFFTWLFLKQLVTTFRQW